MKSLTAPMYKNSHKNWCLETNITLEADDFEGTEKQVQITTTKRHSGQLVTTVIVGTVDDHFFTYVPFQDFCTSALTSEVRCTPAAVKAQHEKFLCQMLDDTLDTIRQHYGVTVPTFLVVRKWQNFSHEDVVQATGLSKAEAKAHCASPETSGEDENGLWMDVFYEE